MAALAVIIPLIVATALAALLYLIKHADWTADPNDWDEWDWEEEGDEE